MNAKIIGGILVGVALIFAASGIASATTYSYTCTNTSGELQLRLNGTSAWTSPGATMAKPISGDLIEINSGGTSTPCLGDIYVSTNGLTFTNNNNTGVASTNDFINGDFEVATVSITILGLNLECTFCSAATVNTANPVQGLNEDGALVLHDTAVAIVKNSEIGPGMTSGVFVVRSSAVSLLNTTVSGNGTAGSGVSFSNGIYASNGSSVRLGNPNGTQPAIIISNGHTGCPGFGILLEQSTGLESFAATIGGTGSNANSCGQMFLETGSSARLEATTITQTDSQGTPAVNITGGSSLLTEANPVSAGTNSISGAGAGAVLISGTSHGVFNSATITATGGSTNPPAMEASGSSNITLAGGNTVTDATSGGIAIEIDHSSSLMHVPGSRFGYTNATESITGAGTVLVQSSMDLGQGVISSNPSISWNLNGSALTVQQNSSFRLSGGIAISNGNVRLQQGSNGFFNAANGGTNAASIICVSSANDPGVHVTGTFTGTAPNQTNTSVTPSFPVYTLNDIMTGVSGATHPGQTNACLSF